MVLTNLLYGCETWTCYRRHIKALDRFHMRHLRILLKIKWQDRITNAEVLERSQSTGIEALLIASQLRWAGHVWRMGDERIPKQLLHGELWEGESHRGGRRKRFKDTLKHNMKQCGINADQWETAAEDRNKWRAGIKQGVELFEAKRLAAMGEKRATGKNRLQQQQQAGAAGGDPSFGCGVCQRDCHSRIGLVSHSRTHRT